MRYTVRLLSSKVFGVVDLTIVVVALSVGLCAADHVKIPAAVDGFLQSHITMLNLVRVAVVALVWTIASRVSRLHRTAPQRPLAELGRIVVSVGVTSLCLAITFNAGHRGASALEIAKHFALVSVGCLLLVRVIVASLSGAAWTGVRAHRNVLVAGTGSRAVRFYRYLRTEFADSHCVIGFVDSRGAHGCAPEIEKLFIGTLEHLEEILLKQVVDEVVLALPAKSCYGDIQRVTAICRRAGVVVLYPHDILPDGNLVFGRTEPFRSPQMISILPAIHDSRLFVKRCFDIVVALFAIVVLSPLLVGTAIAVKLTSAGPCLFVQERYGLGRRRFRMLKFRSMVVDAEKRLKQLESQNEANGPIFKMRSDPRITSIGRFIRRTSIDELPQLFNVLIGDMSLVGPRPMSVRDVDLFDEARQMRRFSVKPGLTGLWQVNGRSETTFERWMELDLRYIENWSLTLDMQILAQTIPAVVKGSGAV